MVRSSPGLISVTFIDSKRVYPSLRGGGVKPAVPGDAVLSGASVPELHADIARESGTTRVDNFRMAKSISMIERHTGYEDQNRLGNCRTRPKVTPKVTPGGKSPRIQGRRAAILHIPRYAAS